MNSLQDLLVQGVTAGLSFFAGRAVWLFWASRVRTEKLAHAMAADALATLRAMTSAADLLARGTPEKASKTALSALAAGYIVTPPSDRFAELVGVLAPKDSQTLLRYVDDYAQFQKREERYRDVFRDLVTLVAKDEPCFEIDELWAQLKMHREQLRVSACNLRLLSCQLFDVAIQSTRVLSEDSTERLSAGRWPNERAFRDEMRACEMGVTPREPIAIGQPPSPTSVSPAA